MNIFLLTKFNLIVKSGVLIINIIDLIIISIKLIIN